MFNENVNNSMPNKKLKNLKAIKVFNLERQKKPMDFSFKLTAYSFIHRQLFILGDVYQIKSIDLCYSHHS